MTIPFLWGSATSSHQVEGDNRANDWWAWEKAGKVKEPSAKACDHYRLFAEDIDLIAGLGHNAHRFSLEWSRLEPQENQWDPAAFDHYRQVFERLKHHGIEPVVTLHHFTNPQWFTERGGWLHPDAASYFLRYVRRVVETYGSYARFWVTFNEPSIYLYFGFLEGTWPPGEKSFAVAMRAFRRLLEAHMAAYREIHRIYERDFQRPVWVSIAQYTLCIEPYRESSLADRWAVFLKEWFVNHLFVKACTTGFLFFPGLFCEFLPVRKSLDFLGVNYYMRNFVRFKGWSGSDALGEVCETDAEGVKVKERNQMGWDIHAPGFGRVLSSMTAYRLPIIVTENGICAIDDPQRARFIQDHLAEFQKLRRSGAPLWGYFYWSLLDNFEWHHGFEPRFGIVEVDYRTQARKIRPSAQILTRLCRNIAEES